MYMATALGVGRTNLVPIIDLNLTLKEILGLGWVGLELIIVWMSPSYWPLSASDLHSDSKSQSLNKRRNL